MRKFVINSPLIFITAFTSAILLLNINNPHVPFTDELLFEEASFQAAKGNWLIPQLNNAPWLEKPPLYFWLTAPIYHLARPFLSSDPLDLSQSLTEQNIYLYPWIRRFWSTIAAIATVVTTGYLSKKIFPTIPYYLAPLILIATPAFIFTSQSASLDIPATACIAIAFLALLNYPVHPRASSIIFILSTSSAIMFRSVFGLTPLILLTYQFLTHQISLKRAALLLGFILSLIFPWHFYAYWQNPQEFLNTYLGFNLIDHALKIPAGYSANPIWYYALFLSIPPWFAITVLYGIKKIIRQPRPTFSHQVILTVLYFLIPFFTLSLSATRHPWYAAQLTVALSLLASASIWHLYKQTDGHPVLKNLIQIFLITCLIASPAMIIASENSSAPNVKALHFASSQTQGQTVYVYLRNYLPNTQLYHPVPIEVVNDQFLTQNQNTLIIYIHDQNLLSPIFQNYHLKLLSKFTPGAIYQLSPNQDNL